LHRIERERELGVAGCGKRCRNVQPATRSPAARPLSSPSGEALRGNLDTRLAKLDRGEFQAIVLAVAGLKRLGLAARIRSMLEPEQSLPAPGQGALAIECIEDRDDLRRQLASLGDAATAACVRSERALSRSLSGSCQLPLAAYAEARGTQIRLRGW